MAESLEARAKVVFDQVIDRSGEERASHLERACAGVPELRHRVEALILAAEKDDQFLSGPTLSPIPTPTPAERPSGEQPGARIGPYTLVELIGEGGFGSVFLAEQSVPVRRQVALKIIKAGMDTKQVIARFEAERQALALMDHPNIARVLEAGATESGRPYFVMELVRGEPVTRYCDRQCLSVPQRLELFRDICGAVQHAHQKGVIHRDLKPSNILITGSGGTPLVKVIDFGIAKATAAARLTNETLTELHQFIGTPEYMSPEQADIFGENVDTRSDIYSLGVLLYELLTGATPFDRKRLASSGLDGLRQILRSEEPLRPSLRISMSGRVRASEDETRAAGSSSGGSRHSRFPASHGDEGSSVIDIADRRRSEPRTLRRTLRGDLDWIALRCLEKDRNRRYATPAALADDIGRYLNHQPVSATPPSTAYALRKFAQRHKGAVVAGSVIAMTLIVAASVSIAFAVKTSRALATAEQNWVLAQRRADETKEVTKFQSGLLAGIDAEKLGQGFKELFRAQVKSSLARQSVGAWPDRHERTPEQVEAELAVYDRMVAPVQAVDVARRVFDRYILGGQVETVEQRFSQQPYVQAELLHTLGVVAQTLGLYDKAESALTKSRELRLAETVRDDIALAETASKLANALGSKGEFESSERLYREAHALYQAHLGDEHHKTINGLNLVAVALSQRGDYAAAADLLREILPLARRLPPEHGKVLAHVLHNLGEVLLARGDVNDAAPFTREALELRRRLPDIDGNDLANTLNTLAGIAYSRREYDESRQLLSEALGIKRQLLGDEHVEVATLINNLGGIHYKEGDRAAAKVLYAEALGIYRRQLGDEHNEVVGTLNNLAMMHQMDGELDVSGPLLREALALRRRLLDADHPDVALSLANLADQLEEEGDLAGSETHYQQSVDIYLRKLAPCHSRRVSSEVGLLRVLIKQGKLDEAEGLLVDYNAKVEELGPGAPCRGEYLKAFIRINDDRDKARPGEGFDRVAAEWREKMAAWQATTRPAER